MKLKNLLGRIPRPLKACVCAVGVVILSVVHYIVLGCPTFTFEQEFRRAERVHLVGPSVIVDTANRQYQDFDRMIVGETEQGICFFGRYYNNYPYRAPFDEKQYLFTYREKTGDMTVAAPPNVWGRFWKDGPPLSLPVYLFTDYPDAIRAEIEMTIQGGYTVYEEQSSVEHSYSRTFCAEATRSDAGFFLFFFRSTDEYSADALRLLSDVSGGGQSLADQERGTVIPATVRLYDSDDQLIIEKELTIRAAAGETHAES